MGKFNMAAFKKEDEKQDAATMKKVLRTEKKSSGRKSKKYFGRSGGR